MIGEPCCEKCGRPLFVDTLRETLVCIFMGCENFWVDVQPQYVQLEW